MVAAKVEQEWEASPPLCRNCDHFLNGGAYKRPSDPAKGKKSASRCALGSFNTTPFAVCQRWEQKGETLARD